MWTAAGKPFTQKAGWKGASHCPGSPPRPKSLRLGKLEKQRGALRLLLLGEMIQEVNVEISS